MMKQHMSELSKVDKVVGRDFPDANAKLRSSLASIDKIPGGEATSMYP